MEDKIISKNRKARHDFFILETFDAGIVLTGTEIKSIREGRLTLKESYARIDQGEVWIYNMHISPYDKASYFNHEELRPRKLLMHKSEIIRLIGKTKQQGLTLVPLSLYLKGNRWAKIEIALAQGKQQHDKREAVADRDAKRDIARAMRKRQIE